MSSNCAECHCQHVDGGLILDRRDPSKTSSSGLSFVILDAAFGLWDLFCGLGCGLLASSLLLLPLRPDYNLQ